MATPIFEGPLELLLALAERQELDLLKVPLAALTDSYLSELAAISKPDPAEMADFLWMAARLLLLKSIRLLPGEEPGQEETELLGWEEEIRLRLQEYRVFKELAKLWIEQGGSEAQSFPAPPREIEVEGQEHPLEAGLLFTALQSVLARVPPRPLTILRRSWSLEEKVAVLTSRLRQGALDLLEVLLESEDRLEAVVTFVALLELLRRGRVRVRQEESFGPIWVEPA